MLALGLDEYELLAPKIWHAIDDGLVEAAAHRGRAGDRKGARALRDSGLHPDHGFGPVARRGDPWVLKGRGPRLDQRYVGRPLKNLRRHRTLLCPSGLAHNPALELADVEKSDNSAQVLSTRTAAL